MKSALADVQARIRSTWAASGIICAAERHSDIADNFSFAEIPEDSIERMVRDVAAEGCEAVAILCTNMRGASIAARLECELGLPIYDSVAVTLWACPILSRLRSRSSASGSKLLNE